MDKDRIIERLTKQVAEQTALVQTLTESNAALNETIKDLQETIRPAESEFPEQFQTTIK